MELRIPCIISYQPFAYFSSFLSKLVEMNYYFAFTLLLVCYAIGFNLHVLAYPAEFSVEKNATNSEIIVKFKGLNISGFHSWNNNFNTTLRLDEIIHLLIEGYSKGHVEKPVTTNDTTIEQVNITKHRNTTEEQIITTIDMTQNNTHDETQQLNSTEKVEESTTLKTKPESVVTGINEATNPSTTFDSTVTIIFETHETHKAAYGIRNTNGVLSGILITITVIAVIIAGIWIYRKYTAIRIPTTSNTYHLLR